MEALLSNEGGSVTQPPAQFNLYVGNEQHMKKNCKPLKFLKCPPTKTSWDKFSVLFLRTT